MTCLNILSFFVFGFIVVLNILFIIVCIFDEKKGKSSKLEEHDGWNAEEM